MKRIETKYLNIDGKLIKVEKNSLYFDNKKIGILFTSVPLNSNSSGSAGDIAYDSNYFYICIQDNKWVRTALAQW